MAGEPRSLGEKHSSWSEEGKAKGKLHGRLPDAPQPQTLRLWTSVLRTGLRLAGCKQSDGARECCATAEGVQE